MLEFYRSEAPSDCVFIHGAGGNSLLWKRTLKGLSGEGAAYAVDLPGHPSGAIACRSVGEYSEAVHRFMGEAGLARSAVCGHSMGSAIALSLAIDHPDEVQALILVDGGAKLGVSPGILDGLSSQPLRAIEELITPMSFHRVGLELGRDARAALSLSNLAVFLNDYRACDAFDVRDRLGEIAARTLVICGESDMMTPPRYSQFLKDRIPNSSLQLISEAGHMVPLERPAELARSIQTFLAGLSP